MSLGHYEYRPGLERIQEAVKRLGLERPPFRVIQVAGSNGKGSTVTYLAAGLSQLGERVGVFISPHLTEPRECLQLYEDELLGQSLGQSHYENLVLEVQKLDLNLSPFEELTAVALLAFAQLNCDVVILEAGLGGLLDATNVLPQNELAILSPISLEHEAELGPGLESIVRHKLGIIKAGSKRALLMLPGSESRATESTILSLAQQHCAQLAVPLFVLRASEVQANYERGRSQDTLPFLTAKVRPARAISHFLAHDPQRMDEAYELNLGFKALYQAQTAGLAFEALRLLYGYSVKPEPYSLCLQGLTLPGRFECLSTSPLVLADGAHNPQAFRQLQTALALCLPQTQKRVYLLAFLEGKAVEAILDELSLEKEKLSAVIFCQMPIQSGRRLADTVQLELSLRRRFGEDGDTAVIIQSTSVEEAYQQASSFLQAGDALIQAGSLYLAAALRSFLLQTRE